MCVSSQVGCTLTCSFCHTGTQRLVRNLRPTEIVAQVMVARDALGEWPSPQDDRQVTNIVLMGMGEPLYNYENVAEALKIVMDPEGLSISRRKITLSTAGVVPMIRRCGAELGVNLAVSLHAVRDEIRDRLVPLNRKYPIAELLDACRTYPGASNARRITFEYVMLKGVNDSPADARELVRLLAGIPAKVNLIPFNPWPGAPYECSSDAAIAAFSDIVFAAGYSAPVRTPRGRDILAACGQLKSASVRLRQERARAAPRRLILDAGLLACCTRCSGLRSSPMRRWSAGCTSFSGSCSIFPDQTPARARRAGAARGSRGRGDDRRRAVASRPGICRRAPGGRSSPIFTAMAVISVIASSACCALLGRATAC